MQMKLKQNIIQIGDMFQVIHTKCAGGSGSRKTNSLLNLIHYQPDIDNIYIYIYIWNFFMEYSNDMQDVYINIEEHNPGKNLKY